jgi:hypothetical protein
VVLLKQHMQLSNLDSTSAWPPFYAPSNTPIWPLYIINALSRFIYQQVQWAKFHLLVKEYSPTPTHEPLVQFYWGPLETTRVNPETSTILPTPHCPIVNKKQLDESLPLSPTAAGYLSQRGDLLGLGTKGTDE